MTKRKQLRIPPSRNAVRRVCRSRKFRSLAHHSRPVGRERRETRGERFSSAGVSAKETGEEEKGREKKRGTVEGNSQGGVRVERSAQAGGELVVNPSLSLLSLRENCRGSIRLCSVIVITPAYNYLPYLFFNANFFLLKCLSTKACEG